MDGFGIVAVALVLVVVAFRVSRLQERVGGLEGRLRIAEQQAWLAQQAQQAQAVPLSPSPSFYSLLRPGSVIEVDDLYRDLGLGLGLGGAGFGGLGGSLAHDVARYGPAGIPPEEHGAWAVSQLTRILGGVKLSETEALLAHDLIDAATAPRVEEAGGEEAKEGGVE